MITIYETDKLLLEYEYEYTQLIEKSTKNVLFVDHFYGNPQCGLIDDSNNWVIVAGVHLTIWTPQKSIKFETEELKWVHSLRLKNQEIVELLIDPWSEHSAIWEIVPITFKVHKVQDFDLYKDKVYTENINW